MELTRTEIESQIKNIDLILKKYDSLIQFIWNYEEDNIKIFHCKEMIMNLYEINIKYGKEIPDIEDTLKKIKSELEIV